MKPGKRLVDYVDIIHYCCVVEMLIYLIVKIVGLRS